MPGHQHRLQQLSHGRQQHPRDPRAQLGGVTGGAGAPGEHSLPEALPSLPWRPSHCFSPLQNCCCPAGRSPVPIPDGLLCHKAPLPPSSPSFGHPFPREDFPNARRGICRYKVLTQCHQCPGAAGIHLGRHPELSQRNLGKKSPPGTAELSPGQPLTIAPRQGHGCRGREAVPRAGDVQRRKRVGRMEEPGQPAHTVKGVRAASAQLWLQRF